MDNPTHHYWKLRLNDLKESLEGNHFNVVIVDNPASAKEQVLNDIIPKLDVQSVSWGGSMTFIATGLYDALKSRSDFTILDTFDKQLSAEASLERRRQSLLADLYLTGTNAVTEKGQLVNLDMIGNRTGAIAFGPKHVIVFVGRNKIVADLEDAFYRIKNYAAPTNVMRLDKKNPCLKTSTCQDCNSPERICNTWSIMEKSFPKGRITVILINEDMGL